MCRPVRTRSVTSNILAQQRRRNGTETWRRRSCQCEHLRLITHEKIMRKFYWTVTFRDGTETEVAASCSTARNNSFRELLVKLRCAATERPTPHRLLSTPKMAAAHCSNTVLPLIHGVTLQEFRQESANLKP